MPTFRGRHPSNIPLAYLTKSRACQRIAGVGGGSGEEGTYPDASGDVSWTKEVSWEGEDDTVK
jgi:hypothetical protein